MLRFLCHNFGKGHTVRKRVPKGGDYHRDYELRKQKYRIQEGLNSSFEAGKEKIAYFENKKEGMTHLYHWAIQLPNGKWRSKNAGDELIEHDTLEQIEGVYGNLVKIYVKDFNLEDWLKLAEEAQKPK